MGLPKFPPSLHLVRAGVFWTRGFFRFLLAHLFFREEGARSRALETGVAPDKERKASREKIGAWELSVAGEISKPGCEGDDLYLSPEIRP